MAGTPEGGRKAAKTNLVNNPNFYAEIGRIGGSTKPSRPRGFAHMSTHNPELFRLASAKGGLAPRKRRKLRT